MYQSINQSINQSASNNPSRYHKRESAFANKFFSFLFFSNTSTLLLHSTEDQPLSDRAIGRSFNFYFLIYTTVYIVQKKSRSCVGAIPKEGQRCRCCSMGGFWGCEMVSVRKGACGGGG